MADSPTVVWTPGAATAIGSMPGDDIVESATLVAGELPDLPYLPELPARGPGADMLGRALVRLPDIHGEVVPSGWRIAQRPGRDARRAESIWSRDLDAFEQVLASHRGMAKVQLTGPWTLAAGIELASGERVVSDHGARRDFVEATAESAKQLVTDLKRRLPALSSLVVQFDEPSLPSVLDGTVPTASGYRTYRHVDLAEVRSGLKTIVDAVHGVDALAAVHCCAAAPPVGLLREAGVDAISIDLLLHHPRNDDALGEAVEQGIALWLGVVASSAQSGGPSDLAGSVAQVRTVWNRLGFAGGQMAQLVVPTPSCGLAFADPGYTRAALTRVREVGRVLLEDPDGDHGRD